MRLRRVIALAVMALVVALSGAAVLPYQNSAAGSTCPCHLFSNGTVPDNPTVASDGEPVELGVRFEPQINGYITGVRFYKAANMTDTHTGTLWDASGNALATGTFTGESVLGWQDLTFSAPVAVTASKLYTASFSTTAGDYIASSNYFASSPLINYPLMAPQGGTTPDNLGNTGNGVYKEGSLGYPTGDYNHTNYWVDVDFVSNATPTPPQVTAVSPDSGSTGALIGTSVVATFDQVLNQASITTSSVTLSSANGLVPATVSYDGASQQITLTPASALSENTVYTVAILGGSSGVQNLDGTPLSTDYSWSFTTGASQCPCSIWNGQVPDHNPVTTIDPASGPVELGETIHATENGYIHAVRFYKSIQDTATSHTVNVWSATGDNLATAVSNHETTTGWQDVQLASPLRIYQGQNYVISYFVTSEIYVSSPNAQASQSGDGPLKGNANGARFQYGASSTFPNQTSTGNYWVDAVFTAVDSYTPTFGVAVAQPQAHAYGVSTTLPITLQMTQPVDPSTLNAAVALKDASNATIAGTTSYNDSTHTISFTPTTALKNNEAYTLNVDSSLKDTLGSGLTAGSYSLPFTTGAPLTTTLNDGKGGPILVITSAADNYDTYLAEMLRAEGINYFDVKDVANLTAATLNDYKMVLLGEAPLTSVQVDALTTWVNAGGNLIALHPDKQLAPLLGLTDTSGTLSNAYLKVDTTTAPGKGITGETMQYHTSADLYSTGSGTQTVATLYDDATTATSNPAVTERAVGPGHAGAFLYDLPQSIALTHQGNPAWSGKENDTTQPVRPDDLFRYDDGGTTSDWLNTAKAHIPQADEQQRLLINMIQNMSQASSPMPRFWILPHGYKAALVMMEDDHGTSNGTLSVFDRLSLSSPDNCSVIDWTCARGGAFLYTNSGLTSTQATNAKNLGFTMGVHISVGGLNAISCSNYANASQLTSIYQSQLAAFQAKYPDLPPQAATRTHCYIWSDWNATPQADVANGIHYNMNYEWYPKSWTGNNTGYLTGSGLNMRFTDSNGNLVDDYQGVTDLDYENDPTSATMDADLAGATGSDEFYGVFGTHYDYTTSNPAYHDLLIAAAKQYNVPMISAHQMLTWKDAQTNSTFTNIASTPSSLSFAASVAEGGEGMQAMVPASTSAGALASLTNGSVAVTYTTKTIKGVSYAVFDATPGTYHATYDTTTYNQADVNQDGSVNYLDFSALANKYGQTGAFLGRVDMNTDNRVDHLDLAILSKNYGK